jgi:plasmid stabilization system protein ParE
MQEAVDWYLERSPAAALRFVEELRRAISSAGDFPASGEPHTAGTRRLALRRFPYAIIYREHRRRIQIFAVAHASRRPGYWTDRI